MTATTSDMSRRSVRDRALLRQVAFTGRLATMTRADATAGIRAAGGHVSEHLSRRTSLLVVGIGGFPLTREGGVTKKLIDAERLGIPIVSEERLRELLRLAEPKQEQKTYRRVEVADLLGIDERTLARWEAMGLIRSTDERFDFRDIVSLRAISELLARDVRPSTIALSMRKLAGILPGTDRPLSQLRIVEQSGELVAELGDAWMAADGQFVINFESAETSTDIASDPIRMEAAMPCDPDSAQEWIDAGWQYEDQGELEAACDAYRRAVEADPTLVEAHFNLGNALRDLGQPQRAVEAFQQAIRLDQSCAPAWYNLADMLQAIGETEQAIEALNHALRASPDFADAHFNLAAIYEQAGNRQAAAAHWRAYLKLDPASDWSLEARRRLSRL